MDNDLLLFNNLLKNYCMSLIKLEQIKLGFIIVLVLVLIYLAGSTIHSAIVIEDKKQTKQEEFKVTHLVGNLYTFEFENHIYLITGKGGLIHAESCLCKSSKK